MTEKRFELKVNQHDQCDIVDWVESKEKNAICIYNDLGCYYFSSAKALCELLNDLHKEKELLKTQLQNTSDQRDEFHRGARENANRVKKLKKENEQLKQSYKEFEDECQSTFNAMSRKQNDLYRKNFKLKEENEQLKSFIEDLTTKGTGRIDLANGHSYKVSAVLTNWKGDV